MTMRPDLFLLALALAAIFGAGLWIGKHELAWYDLAEARSWRARHERCMKVQQLLVWRLYPWTEHRDLICEACRK